MKTPELFFGLDGGGRYIREQCRCIEGPQLLLIIQQGQQIGCWCWKRQHFFLLLLNKWLSDVPLMASSAGTCPIYREGFFSDVFGLERKEHIRVKNKDAICTCPAWQLLFTGMKSPFNFRCWEEWVLSFPPPHEKGQIFSLIEDFVEDRKCPMWVGPRIFKLSLPSALLISVLSYWRVDSSSDRYRRVTHLVYSCLWCCYTEAEYHVLTGNVSWNNVIVSHNNVKRLYHELTWKDRILK